MKTAKSYKLILLTITLVLAVLAGLMLIPSEKAFAAAPSVSDNPKSYFSTTGSDMKYANDNVEVTVKNGDTFKFINNVLVNDLGYEFIVEEAVSSVELKFTTDSKYVNGNPKTKDDGKIEYVTTISNILKITYGASDMTVDFNGESQTQAISRNLKVVFTEEEGVLSVKVNDGDAISNDDEAYLIKEGSAPATGVTLTFGLAEEVSATFSLVSVDQKVSNSEGLYKQTFKWVNKKMEKFAYPIAVLNDAIYSSDGSATLKNGKQYTVTVKSYSIFGTSFANSMRVNVEIPEEKQGDVSSWYANSEYPKSFVVSEKAGFGVDESLKLNIEYVTDKGKDSEEVWVVETLDVKLYEEMDVAPSYNFDETARKSFEEALLKNTKITDEDGKETYIRLGDTLKIPSMKDMVKETATSYDYMTYTVYYMTPSSSLSSTAKMEIPIGKAGDYKFFVIFKDEFGNQLEKDDFYTTAEGDSNEIIEGTYFDYVFSFHVEDDAPLSVVASEQGEGFVNAKYVASSFEIEAHGYTTTYTLYYNENKEATADSDGWVEIIKKSVLTDAYNNEVFTADEIKEINYDGQLTFTPSRIGSYKIVCTTTSNNTSRTAEDTAVIRVLSESVDLETQDTVLEFINDNIWSVVFLSIGAICLVAIFVLLLVKPKEDAE